MSQMAGRQSITILHLSDLQFGKNHRYGLLGLPPPDDEFDTLFARLTDDLKHLRVNHSLAPELIIVSGDIAEWGKAKEFDDALELLEKLSHHLALPRHRIVVVPGNHDVNRKSCEAYFNQCEADDREPVSPFWPKWTQYSDFCQKLYKDKPELIFTPDQPWMLFPMADLKLVVAGLNSTMAETHLIHKGYAGETQYRWFFKHLEPFRRDGWLRIGAIHHNVQRNCTDDDENLHDANDLKRLLGPVLNLCLHGHTHEASIAWLEQHVPIVSTGSAAVVASARPEEVPNQYQLLRLSARNIERFTRFFSPREKKWMADPRGSTNGDDWITRHKVAFSDVAGTFTAARTKREREREKPEFGRGDPFKFGVEGGHRDDFLSRVAEVCRHRHPNANVQVITSGESNIQYLRVVERDNSFVRTYPLGAFEQGMTSEDLDRFLNYVALPYRASDPTLSTEIVYGGTDLPAPEILRKAEQSRVRMRSFVEYQGITDFRLYVQRQTSTLERDQIYPPSLYVPQRMRFVAGSVEGQTDDALAQVQEWLVSPDARFVVILGDFGTGKTFLLHELARQLGGNPHGPTPVLVDLRALEKARTLDTLIAQHLAVAGIDRIDLAAFRYMLKQGRIVLLFDGFDELALRVSYERASEHFDTILQAASGDAKVVVTSRTQHFESDKQVRTILYDRAQPVPGLRYCKLLSFEQHQIRQFLINRWRDEVMAHEWLELLHDVKDLLGLSENPRMLGFITELDRDELRKTKLKEGGVVSAAKLYQLLLERWLIFEYERAHLPGVEVTLTRDERWAAVTAIANRLWQKTEKFLSQAELFEEVTAALRPLRSTPPDVGIATHLIGSGSLLRRDDEGSFFFVHQSVLEWLVARQAAAEVVATRTSPALGVGAMSQLMTDFFCDLAGRETVLSWAQRLVEEERTDAGIVKTNALGVLARLGGTASLSLAGQDLRGRDLANISLRGADLRGADLTEARLAGKDLTDARLEGATLVRADLTRAILTNASLQNANFSEASLLGADLRKARIAGGIWRRAKLVAALIENGELAQVDTWGAALPDTKVPQTITAFSASCHSVAWSHDGSLLATGHYDRNIRIWDPVSGHQLHQFTGHEGPVRSVTFSHNGQWLASSGDDNTVRLWDPVSGHELRQFTDHERSVRSVVFSYSDQWLASGSDETVRLWDPASGHELRQFTGHRGLVRSVAFSHDGKWLASGSDDNTVRLWDPVSGQELRRFTGHTDWVRSVAFSHDGRWLASGSDDETVRLWDLSSGNELRQFKGNSYILSVAFSSDDRLLASGEFDKTVRLWDPASSHELRRFIGHEDAVSSVTFSFDGRFASGGGDTVRLWDLTSGQEVRQFVAPNIYGTVIFSLDGPCLGTCNDNTIQLWDWASGQQLRQFPVPNAAVWSVALSRSGQLLASGDDDAAVRLWDLTSGQEMSRLVGHRNGILSVAFSLDSQLLASGSDDNTARLWRVSSGEQLYEFTHKDSVRSVAFSHDGQWLASGSDDNTVKLWNSASGEEQHQFIGHQDWVRSVAFSHDDKLLASGSDDKTVRLWNPGSGEELCQFNGHRNYVRSVTFSCNSQWLASGGDDHTVRLWDPVSGKELRRLTGHSASVISVAFSHDSKLLASGGEDHTMRLWDPETGALKLTLLLLADGWAAFTPDGRYKHVGNLAGNFWYAVNLCRFELGELDPFLPNIRSIPLDEPF